MKLMKSKEGAYMYCYTPAEVKRAKSKGWQIVPNGEPKKVKK